MTLYAQTIISWVIILIVGCIKDFDVFKNIEKSLRKPFYLAIDCMLGFGLSALYFLAFKISFAGYINFCIAIIPMTLSLYAIYENTKLKDLVKIAKDKIIAVVGKNIIDSKVNTILNSINTAIAEPVAEPQSDEEQPVEEQNIEPQKPEQQQ